MEEYQLYTTMGAGFESVVAKELQSLGYETTTENGRVFFLKAARKTSSDAICGSEQLTGSRSC